MKDFAAIDFETANYKATSICSVGVVIVKDGQIADKLYHLICPTPNYYVRRFTDEIHGISRADTDSAPTFPEVWAAIAPRIAGLPLVAHNSPFDEGCLRATHNAYGIAYPNYTFHCTCRASRSTFGSILSNHQLHTVAAYCGFDLRNHHHALADAEACAVIAMKIFA
ncbi:DNA polymerase III subunit epsilon [Bacteroidia bacterium]|nr:DNA polymerase III subunit epsilon [Bacteroidia bacterium]